MAAKMRIAVGFSSCQRIHMMRVPIISAVRISRAPACFFKYTRLSKEQNAQNRFWLCERDLYITQLWPKTKKYDSQFFDIPLWSEAFSNGDRTLERHEVYDEEIPDLRDSSHTHNSSFCKGRN